jgi:curved DNA-binding protein
VAARHNSSIRTTPIADVQLRCTVPTKGSERRKEVRRKSDVRVIRIQLKDRMGNPKWVTADVLDVSDNGMGISILGALVIGSTIVVRGKLGSNSAELVSPATVMWCTEQTGGHFHAGLEMGERAVPKDHNAETASATAPDELDCYETMQLSPNADADTIQRVYRILAQRYHPDAVGTGNNEIFLKLCEAHRILSDPEQRARYDVGYRETKQVQWKIFDRAEAATGAEAEQRKRRGILELLYAKTIHDPDRGAMTVFEFEQYLGCPREHLEAALWYLKGKDYVKRGDNGRFTITVPGFDEVESHSETKERRERRLLEPALATGD